MDLMLPNRKTVNNIQSFSRCLLPIIYEIYSYQREKSKCHEIGKKAHISSVHFLLRSNMGGEKKMISSSGEEGLRTKAIGHPLFFSSFGPYSRFRPGFLTFSNQRTGRNSISENKSGERVLHGGHGLRV